MYIYIVNAYYFVNIIIVIWIIGLVRLQYTKTESAKYGDKSYAILSFRFP